MISPRRFTIAHPDPLLEFLIASLELKRKDIKNLLKYGAISVNGVTVSQFDHQLAIGDEVGINNLRTAIAARDLKRALVQIVYEDDAIMVLEKPAGLLTVATANEKTDTLYCRLNRYLQARDRAGPEIALIVHRLDQETSGLVLFAKSQLVRQSMRDDWAAVQKVYQAAVVGVPDPAQGTIATYLTETKALQVFSNDHQVLNSRLAKTHYRLLQTDGHLSLLEVRLATGRKHQIRVHLAGLDCPVVGDGRYGKKSDQCDRLALHAVALEFAHPVSGERLRFESPLPAAIGRLFPRRRGHADQ